GGMCQNLLWMVQIPERPILLRHLIADDGAYRHLNPFQLSQRDASQVAVELVAGKNVAEAHTDPENTAAIRLSPHQRQGIAPQAKVSDEGQCAPCGIKVGYLQTFCLPPGQQVGVRQGGFAVPHGKTAAEKRNPPWEHCTGALAPA